ncbi:MAG: hypothetical protein B1H02_06315 [Candidatus Latescibacteria bacterium 4484_107]|nr:MAG: hypothetical protein B1H02_06315 [Candidatus Latescibacteria bacterium 4484_107]
MNLKKELGLLDVFCIASGAMLSSGLFVLPGLAFAKTGPAVIVAYLLAAVLVVPAMFSKAELATAMPKSGGTYFFIERSLGGYAGALGGIASWFSLSFKSAFALIGIGAFAALVYPDITEMQLKLVAVGCCLFFMILNMVSAKVAGKVQVVLVFGLLIVLAGYIFLGFGHIRFQRYVPFMPSALGSVFATAGLVFISYGGLTKIAGVAEEVKNPRRNLPLGMFAAFIVVSLIYVVVITITIGLVDPAQLAGSLTPISLGASAFAGTWGSVILAIAALTAFITTSNAGILAASRFPMAMSRDRLLPEFFGKINERFGTPHVSILVTSAFMISVILFLGLEDFVKTASTLKIVLFLLVNVSVIIMRESKIQNYRPSFRSPLYPWMQIFGIVAYLFLIVEMGAVPLLVTGGFAVLGFIWFRFYARSRIDRKAALIRVVGRVTAKELAGRGLEKELRGILMERDNIIEDRFDHLIKECAILDLEGSMTSEAFFRTVSDTLSESVNVDAHALFDLFMEREKMSSTVVHPGLAIPHVIVEGSHQFDILLARCKAGIAFSDDQPPVRTVFILLGSRDERNYHLRALMAIAQIVQEEGFEARWLRAGSLEALRDVILLSNRKRDG